MIMGNEKIETPMPSRLFDFKDKRVLVTGASGGIGAGR